MVTARRNHYTLSQDQVDAIAARARTQAKLETENAVFRSANSSALGNSPWDPQVLEGVADIAGTVAGKAAEASLKDEATISGGFATVDTLANFALMVPIVATCTLILDQLITYRHVSTTWIAVAVSALAAILLAISTWSGIPDTERSSVKRWLTGSLVFFNTLILAATALGIGKFVGATA